MVIMFEAVKCLNISFLIESLLMWLLLLLLLLLLMLVVVYVIVNIVVSRSVLTLFELIMEVCYVCSNIKYVDTPFGHVLTFVGVLI